MLPLSFPHAFRRLRLRRIAPGRLLVPLLAALVALCGSQAKPALAHANLVRSEPAAGANLERAPGEIVLTFTEALDASFTRVQLFDSSNKLVDAGPGLIRPDEPTVLRLEIAPLPNDGYTAIWRNRSTVDGHVTEGSVPFGIGTAVNAAVLIPPLGTPDPTKSPPPPLDALLRWLNLLAAAVALGPWPFALLIWRPVFKAWAPPGPGAVVADARMSRQLRRIAEGGAAGFLVTSALQLVGQAALAANLSPLEAIGAPVWNLLTGRWGEIWLLRVILIELLIVIARRLPAAGTGARRPWWVGLCMAGGVLLTIGLNGHGAALERGAALIVAFDWFHLAGMVVWIGGLLPLLLAVEAAIRHPATALPLARLIPRFSRWAIGSVVLLAFTGYVSALVHLVDPVLLVTSSYGRALAVKLVLFGCLLVLGVLNLGWLSRRLADGNTWTARAFRRTIRAELALATLLLLAVGAMTAVAPSWAAWQAEQRAGMIARQTIGDVDLVLRVAPGLVGDNALAVDLEDPRPSQDNMPTKVLLNISRPNLDVAPLQAEAILDPSGGLAARSAGSQVNSSTPADAKVQAPTSSGSKVKPSTTLTTSTTSAAAASAVAGVQRYITSGSYFPATGQWQVEVVVRRSGLDDVRHTFPVDIVRTAEDRTAIMATGAPLPIPSSPASIAAGAKLYAERCAVCHGPKGEGDGPAARTLNPPPARMALHVPQHEDGVLYQFIQKGIPDTAMPTFADQLSSDEVWHLVNYLRDTYGSLHQ